MDWHLGLVANAHDQAFRVVRSFLLTPPSTRLVSATDVLSLLLVISVALTVLFWWRIPRPRGQFLDRAKWLFFTAFILELGGFITRFYCWNNAPVYNVFQLYEYILVLVLIATVEHTLMRTARILGLIGAVAFIVVVIRQEGLFLLATDAILLFSAILSVLLMRMLYLQAKHSETALYRVPAFWFFMGCLVYFGGLIPTIGGIRLQYLIDPVLAQQLWIVVPILAIVRYALSALACYLAGRSN